MTLLTLLPGRLDERSRKFVHQAAIRLGWYGVCLVPVWLIFTEGSLSELAANFQFACTVGAVMAIARACSRRLRVDAPFLNDWDEATLLNLLGLGVHLSQRLLT